MKKPLRGATLALIAVSPFAHLACSDDSISGGGTFTLPTVDASIAPVADAAPAVDASVDAPDADSGPATTATVHLVTARKAPEANVKVVFYDAVGAVLGTETTDATGQATHTMPAGGSVTAVFGTATESNLVTIQGVQPGDALTMLDPARVFNVTFAVTAPVGALPGSAPHLSLRLGNCERGFATGQTVFMAVRYCGHPADIATVVLTALDDSNVVVASTAQAAVTLIEDSVGTTAVTFASPWVTSTTGTTTVTNVPTVGVFTNSNPLAQVGSSTGSGIDLVTIIDFRGSPADLSNNEYMGSFSRLLPGAAFTQNEFDLVETPRDGEGTVLGLVTRALVTRGAIAATTTLDFSTPLPAISSTAVAGGATPTVTWTSKAPLTGTKAIETFFTWFTGNNVGTWLVYAPPTATSIAPPSLPTALVAFGPTAQSAYSSPPFVGAIDATFLPSYATVRASAAALAPDRGLEEGAGYTVAPALPVDGTLRLTAFSLRNDD